MVQITIPNVSETLDRLMGVESTFDGTTQPVRQWISEHRRKIKENLSLIEDESSANAIPVLNIFLRDLLARAIKGEMWSRVYEELARLFFHAKVVLVYVTAFLDRGIIGRYLGEIAWETEVWVADAPTRLIHFNGSRFLVHIIDDLKENFIYGNKFKR